MSLAAAAVPPSPVGVVGLGAMGAPMARHLASAGRSVVVRDLDPQRTAEAARHGCAVAADLAGLAKTCRVVFVVVPSDDDVGRVCLGGDGLVSQLPAEAVVVVCSSVHPATVRALAAGAADRGPAVLDAALTGGVRAAEDGTINLLVGGDAAALDRIRDALDPWCASVHHLGSLGAGQIAKSANNLVHWAQIAAIEEALDLARRHGLSVPAVRAALMAGPTDSRTLRELERMRLTWWAKDLESVRRLGDEVDRELPVAAMCAARMPEITVESLRRLLSSTPSSDGNYG